MQIALTDYGARIVSALVPDKRGDLTDVVLGFDSIAGYLQAKESYHGATIGRYGNRIAGGKFTLDDIDYTLAQNNGINALHGGVDGFHRQVWDRQVNFNKVVIFYHVSPASAEGFPGELKTTVSFELTNDNQIIIKYRATTNAPTIINLTNHAYFNLNGEGSGDILDHDFQIHSEQFLPINENQIPTGEFRSVDGRLFDFRQPTSLKTRLERQDEQLRFANGFDHTFINNQAVHQTIASAYSRKSGIQLDVLTTEPDSIFIPVIFYPTMWVNPDSPMLPTVASALKPSITRIAPTKTIFRRLPSGLAKYSRVKLDTSLPLENIKPTQA